MNDRDYVTPRPSPEPPRRSRLVPALGIVVGLSAVVLLVLMSGAVPTTWFAAAPPTSDAQPYLQNFAGQLTGEAKPPLPEEDAEEYSYGETVDGCDHSYGKANICVPYNFPPGVAKTPEAKCRWLASQGFRSIEVNGKDRHQLAPAGGPRSPAGKPWACPGVLPTA